MTIRGHKKMVKAGRAYARPRTRGYITIDSGARFAATGPGHAQAYRGLLEGIAHYAAASLALLESGAGDLPQWTNDILSKARTHLGDVTHFLRGQASQGIRYGSDAHGRAYMAAKNLREVLEYANESLSHLEHGAGHFPAWVENKISVTAEYMDLIGHWLKNESVEGRKYGSYLNPVPGDAGDEALYRGRADGIGGQRRNPYSPNNFQHKIYEQGFEEGYGTGARRYGVPGIPAGMPGWAGNAGVAQIPHPSRGAGRPIAVQTYGSLGYASMASTKKKRKKKR